jgi:hypothetical protein
VRFETERAFPNGQRADDSENGLERDQGDHREMDRSPGESPDPLPAKAASDPDQRDRDENGQNPEEVKNQDRVGEEGHCFLRDLA